MSTELVERLRAMAAQTRDCTVCDGDGIKASGRECGGCNGSGRVPVLRGDPNQTVSEAADELTALTADRDAGRKVYLILQQAANVLAAKNTALTAKVALLTEALKAVRSTLVRLAWEENSIMIEGIDKAIQAGDPKP